MANNGFGAYVSLHVKKDAASIAAFNRELEQAINNAGKIDISKSITAANVDALTLGNSIQLKLDRFNFRIRIQRFDADGAIASLRNQIESMIGGINVGGAGGGGGTGSSAASASSEATLTRQRDLLTDIIRLQTQAEVAFNKDILGDTGATGTRLKGIISDLQNLQRQVSTTSEMSESEITEINSLFSELRLRVAQVAETVAASGESGDAAAQSSIRQLNLLNQIEQKRKQINGIITGHSKIVGTPLESELREQLSVLDELELKIKEMPYISQTAKDQLTVHINNVRNAVAGVQNKMVETGQTGNTMFTRLANGFKKFGGWMVVTRVLTSIIRLGRQVVTNVKEIDSAMTQLRIVTQESRSMITDAMSDIARSAKEAGASMADLTDSATTYARLGYSLNEATSLAKYTSMLQTVGDIDVSDAQDAITAITKAFNIDVDNIELVMDKLVEVGNNFPISVSQIAEGLNNASSALAGAGNTFEQSVALLTAANTTVQNVSKASTGLRTITARLRNTKVDLEELGEEMTEPKYEALVKALTDAHVALRDVNGDYRATYDIIADIAAQWDKMSSTQQAALITNIAGTRQQDIFQSLVRNFNEASSAMDAMANSAGALTEAHSIYLDSVEGRTQQLKATFEEFSQNVLNSDVMKGLITSLTSILTVLGKIMTALGGLPALISAIAVAVTVLNIEKIKTAIVSLLKSFTSLPTLIATVVAAIGYAIYTLVHNQSFEAALDKLKESSEKLSETTNKLAELNNELNTTKQRIRELESKKDSLTVVEQAELDKLKETNLQLERQKQIQEDLRKGALEQVQTDFVKAASKWQEQNEYGFKDVIERYKWYQNELEKGAQLDQADLDMMAMYKTDATEWITELQQAREALDGMGYDNLTDSAKEYYDYCIAREAEFSNFVSGRSEAAFEYFSSDKFAKQRKGLELLKEEFADIDSFNDAFDQKFKELFSNSDVQDFADAIGVDLATAYEVLQQRVKDYYNEQISGNQDVDNDINETISKLKSNTDQLVERNRQLQKSYADLPADMEAVRKEAERFNKLTNGNVDYFRRPLISPEEMRKVYPEFDGDIATTYSMTQTIGEGEQMFTMEVTPILPNGHVLNEQELSEYLNSLVTDQGLQGLLDSDKYNLIIQAQPGDYDEEYWTKFNEALGDVKETHWQLVQDVEAARGKTYSELAAEFDEAGEEMRRNVSIMEENQYLINALSKDYETLSTELKDAQTAFSKVSSAIKEVEENGSISSKTLAELLELQPEYLNLLVDENGNLSLTTDSYEQLIKAKLRNMLINQMDSAFDHVLGLEAEKAAAYAAAEAYDAETVSVWTLVKARMRLALMDARDKDAENGTDAYTQAVIRTGTAYLPLINAVENYSLEAENATKSTSSATKATDEHKEALEAEKKAIEDQKDALEDSKKALEDYKSELSDAQSSLQSLIDVTVDYIKQLKEDEKDALNDQIDALEKQKDVLDEQKDTYSDIIAKKKEALELAKKEQEEADELADKQNKVAKDALALAIANLDDSSAGKKAQKIAADNYAESSKELQKYLSDRSYDMQIAALEEEEKKFEENIDKQKELVDGQVDHIKEAIDRIDEYLDNERKVYEDACAMIENDTGELYNNLWEYTYAHTTKTRAEFDHMWNAAQEAMEQYGVAQYGVISVMEFLQSEIYYTDTQIDALDRDIDALDSTIDSLSDTINSLNDSVNNAANSGLTNFTNKMNDMREEYRRLLDELQSMSGEPSTNVWTWDYGDFHAWATHTNPSDAAQAIWEEYKKSPYFNSALNMGVILGGMKWKSYAGGTFSAAGGISRVNEEGHEIRVLNKGDGILTAQITKNLSNLGATLGSNPLRFFTDVGKELLAKIGDVNVLGGMFRGTPALAAVGGSGSDMPITIVNHITGDVNPSTLKALEQAEDRIVNKAFNQTMKKTLSLRNTNRIR